MFVSYVYIDVFKSALYGTCRELWTFYRILNLFFLFIDSKQSAKVFFDCFDMIGPCKAPQTFLSHYTITQRILSRKKIASGIYQSKKTDLSCQNNTKALSAVVIYLTAIKTHSLILV